MTFTTKTKATDNMHFNGKVNCTRLNREVRIRIYDKVEGRYVNNRLVTARQLCELLGEERMLDVLDRFARHMDDADFTRKFRGSYKVQFSWR